MSRTIRIGDGGAGPPHNSTTTTREATALVRPLVQVVQALVDQTAEQGRLAGQLLAELTTAGSGLLGRPGHLDQIRQLLSDLDEGAKRIASIEAARAQHAQQLLDGMAGRGPEDA
jgi:hypothetical protein